MHPAETSTSPNSTGQWPRLDRSAISTADSFEEADRLDREDWWTKTPLQRMQALELVRQVAYGYGPGKPLPRFQRVLEVAQLR
jgi:hypothetical protein